MGIKTKNCEEYSVLRGMFGRHLSLPMPITDDNNVVASASPPAVGAAHTLAQDHLIPSTLIFSMGSSTGSVTYEIIGRNQFGEAVTESITLTGSASVDAETTVNAFSKITSITVTAKSGSPGAMIVGQDFNHATVRMSIGLPYKGIAGDVESARPYNLAFNASPTVDATYHTLEIGQISNTVPSFCHVFLAEEAWLKH